MKSKNEFILKNKHLKEIIIYTTFLIFCSGIISFTDFGVSVDEWDLEF